jgi:hypothetical protein
MNRAARDEVPSYNVGFADYQGPGGAMRTRTIVGNDHLKSFLGLEIGVRSETIDSTFKGLAREGSANIFNVVLPDDKLARLGLL